MKISKFIFLAILTITIASCGSDDDSGSGTPDQIVITPSVSIGDIDGILALPPGTDITDLISFGQPNGVSTADQESVLELGERFVLARPAGLLSTDIFIYDAIYFFDELDEEIDYDLFISQYLTLVIPSGESASYYEEAPTTVLLNVDDVEDEFDLNWKYDIECYIVRESVEYGPFIIDPKLRLKGRNTLN
ncbi:hypothetical protein [Psychroserpens jangbogonensis]|uniref:hypothetical protein n=1 Tax=Psychroserpens jangbogonensis TaxID=1484460 RepID=UPI00053E46D9|nr:hypothetical protein [Psychroserpens jangbogonensis]